MKNAKSTRLYFVFILISVVCLSTQAQVTTGTPPFGSFGGGPDVINLANLNSHINVPVLRKAGRGTPFTYSLSYDTSVWYPVSSGGSQTWTPVYNWGWRGQTEASTGYLSSQYGGAACSWILVDHIEVPNGYHYWTKNFVYHDPWGIAHSFVGETDTYSPNCGGTNDTISATATDGSGYSINGGTITARNGNSFVPPASAGTGAATFTDRNGNQISVNSSGVFTDTLGGTALTVTNNTTNTTFAYTAPSGATATYTMKYTTYTVQTNFGCSGISEYSASNASLVSEIDLPDSTKYSFTYEPTPGNPSNKTGRLASVTLPTGGTISYTYTGGSNGVECADGSTSGLTRITPDGTWKYARSGSGSAWATTTTDPTLSANQTVIDFQEASTTQLFYETERQVYQGSVTSGALLKTVSTCYNGSASPCNSTAITLPLAQRTTILQWPGASGLQSKTTANYNSFGSVTETDEYAYGTGAPGSLVRQTLISYASLGNGIVGMPASVIVKDSSNHIVSQIAYTYDQGTPTATSGTPQHVAILGTARGNATTISSLVGGTTNLTKTFTYYDTGTVNVATDFNGATTTNNYGTGSCGNSFPTSVSESLTLSRSMTWNCTGGVETTVSDENGNIATTSYTDPYFWRPNSSTDRASNVTSLTYGLAASVESSLLFNGGNSTVDVLATRDGLGRSNVAQVKEGPSSTIYDSAEADFDTLGRPTRRTLPYSGIAGQLSSSAPSTNTSYDALGRKYLVTDGGGLYTTFAYAQNDVYKTIGPAPSAENAKRNQLEYDAFGRVTSACEITSGTGSGTCGQTIAATGYWTQYTYDLLNHLTGVTQNAQAVSANRQTRTYTHDGLGRLTSEANPETNPASGSATPTVYTYDSDTICGTSKGDLVKRVDQVGNTSCYAYDALHRTISVTYSGPYASSTPNKYFVYDSATVNSIVMANVKGRMAEAYTATCSTCTKITDIGLSYTVRGELSNVYESTPHSAGFYHVSQSYWANGAPNQLSGLSGLPTITYGVDGEGRVYSVSASSGQNPVTSTTYNVASASTQVNFGSSDSDTFTYDPNTNRMTKYQFNVNGQSVVGTLTWNSIWTLGSLAITDPFNSGDSQTCSYTHDDLYRIASDNCGSGWSQAFSYDAFGNLSKSGTMSFQPTYSAATNHMTQIGSSTPTYDANGNVTNDFLHTYAWNAGGRPVTVDTVGVTYDALGRMVEQNRGGTYTEIVYTPSGAKLALMNGTALREAFVPLPGGSSAVYNSSGLAYYRHSDHLGSSRFASTSTRTMYFDGAYAPFGEPYAQTGSTDLSFTGSNQDTVANLYDFPAREYGTQGRWPSPDPAGISSVSLSNPQTLNRYAYVMNSPLSYADSLGLHANDCWWTGTCMSGGDGPLGAGGGGGGGNGNPFGGDCGILDGCSNPSSWLPWSAQNSSNESEDPNGNDCGLCIYLNDAGTGVTPGSSGTSGGMIDTNSNTNECKKNGGVFVDESADLQGQIDIYYDPNSDSILVTSSGASGGVYWTEGQPGQPDIVPTGLATVMDHNPWNDASWKLGYDSAWSGTVGCAWNYGEVPENLKSSWDIVNKVQGLSYCIGSSGLIPVDPNP